MPTAKEFAREVEALALTITGYEEGKSGQRGLCDCIGLVMGAMARLGHGSYPIRDTNYFERYQTNNLQPVSNADELRIGQIVYKSTDDLGDLNARYKPGGRYHKPDDMVDWYHIGVVTDVNPLEITHCTQDKTTSGIKRDSSIKGWSHAGEVKGVDYATDNHVSRNEEAAMIIRTAYVVSEDGKPVRMRSMPTAEGAYNTIKKVSTGTVVDVLEAADGWAKIEDPAGEKGYMMEKKLKYLEYADEEVPDDAQGERHEAAGESDEVMITLPREAAKTLFKALSEVVV